MNAVKIGKTNYNIIETKNWSGGGFDYTTFKIKVKNTTKTLVHNQQLNTFTLWSGREGLPKMVEPLFNDNNKIANNFFSKVEGAYK